MANILVLPSEVVGEAESGNSYAFPADNILMSDKTTSVEEAINNKPGEKIPGTEEDSVGGEIFNDYTNNIASGEYSHAEGAQTTASGGYSHAEGIETIASGKYSHSEGTSTEATGDASHAEGSGAIASGNSSHAEGCLSIASAMHSHAEGVMTKANGIGSHVEGTGTISTTPNQHVQGANNIEDTEGLYAHIVGWGTNRNKKNIHTIDTNGNSWYSGKVSAGTPESPANPTEANDLITKKYFEENSGSDVGQKSIEEEDTDGIGGEIFNNYANNTAYGNYSHAEGNFTTASGFCSHAEGQNTTASGDRSHAEGYGSVASYIAAHAEGTSTKATANSAHAEGSGTVASALASHAEGELTEAASRSQHVQGRYNIIDSEGVYAHIVGWGTSSTSRSNIHTITTTGDGWFAGKVSAGTVETPSSPTEANDLVTKKYFDENIVKDYTELDNIPTMNSIPISGDKSAVDYGLKPKDFEVTITGNSDSGYTSNKTFDEIEEAHNSGATVIARISNGPDIGYLVYKSLINTGSIKRVNFIQVSGLTRYSVVIDGVSNTVTVDITELISTESKIGGVKANQATDDDVIDININEDGFLKANAKPNDYIVTFTSDESGTYTCDKTFEEVLAACKSGATVKANVDELVMHPEVFDYKDTVINFETQRGSTYLQILMGDGLIKVNNKNLVASSVTLGMVQADKKSNDDTTPVHIGDDNKLYVSAKPSDLIVNVTGDEPNLEADIYSDEIISAIQSGRTVYALYDNYKYEYLNTAFTTAIFEREFGLEKVQLMIDETGLVIVNRTSYEVETSSNGVGQLYPNEVSETNPNGTPGEIFNCYEDNVDLGAVKNIASGMYSHAEGSGTEASGMVSHAEGNNTQASGDGSHSEGNTTIASGIVSHAEGNNTQASGDGSHSEGNTTIASGIFSHAEGTNTVASGDESHAEGMGTIAASKAQHVEGKYNIEDTEGLYAHIIGGGLSDSDRKNIHMIDWNGNAYFDGRVIINPNNINPLEATELVTMGYVNSLLSGGGSENGNFLSDPMIFQLSIGPTIPNEFSNITKLPDGYSVDNTLILSVIDIPNAVTYFGSSSYDFIIRITEEGYVQIRFINNAESIGRRFYLLLCKFSLPSTINVIDLFNNNNI